MRKFNEITLELLMHKYRYYVLDNPSVSDYTYDMIERDWTKLGEKLGINMEDYKNWVDFPVDHPLADIAKKLVNKESVVGLDSVLDTLVSL